MPSHQVSLDVRVLWTVVPGVAIIVFAFTEIFQDLFHPTHTGSLSDWIGRSLFRLFRRWPSALSTAGPLTIVLVIFCWALLQAVGFALIYCAGFPGGFQLLNREQNAGVARGFWTMLYFSFQVMTTLGLGDVMPKADWLRIVASLQALIGLALLTASVSSIVLIYPALGRMPLLARRTTILDKAAKETGIDVISGDVENFLSDLANAVIQTRVDFIHFPIIYYFHSDHRRSSLAAALPKIIDFAKAGSSQDAPERVRLASATLRAALQDLARFSTIGFCIRSRKTRRPCSAPMRRITSSAKCKLTRRPRQSAALPNREQDLHCGRIAQHTAKYDALDRKPSGC